MKANEVRRLIEHELRRASRPSFPERKERKRISRNVARTIYDRMGYDFDFEEFYKGINVELEHRDITNGNIAMTAKIAAAHLREKPNYYTLLDKYVEVSESLNETSTQTAYIKKMGPNTYSAWKFDISSDAEKPVPIVFAKNLSRKELISKIKSLGFTYVFFHGLKRPHAGPHPLAKFANIVQ